MKGNNSDKDFHRVLGEMLQEAYQKNQGLNIKIVTGSMSPLIEAGDVVRIIPVEPSGIHTGDIVAFREGPRIVVHRIVGKIRSNRQVTGFHQRSDTSGLAGVIASQDVIGRVVTITKEGREIYLDTARCRISSRIFVWRGWSREWFRWRQ